MPEDAAAVSVLLEELGYATSSEMAAERVRRIQHRAPVARITALVIHQPARRRGIASLLIDHALRWAEQSGCELVELTSALNRTEAHTFYRDLGFEPNSLRFRKSLGS